MSDKNEILHNVAVESLRLRLIKEPGPWGVSDLIAAVTEFVPVSDEMVGSALNVLDAAGETTVTSDFKVQYLGAVATK